MASVSLRRTPLHGRHVALGARLVEFAGFEMPVSYDGILAEHHRVRRAAGLFDVSHMGEAEIRGIGAQAFLEKMTTNSVASLAENRAQYTLLLNRRGGVIDDLLVYRLPDRYLLVVNAANAAKDFEWIASHLPKDVEFRNVSEATALLAWQGPKAAEILAPLIDADLSELPAFGVRQARVAGSPVHLARTGYTGEDGFEVFVGAAGCGRVWDAILEAGETHGAGPAGLGARDTLRLEKQFRLWGRDMDESVTALEAGLSWVVRFDKGDFVGKEALLAQKESGVPRATVGLKVVEEGRYIPRPGCAVLSGEDIVGEVTSGTFSPTLEAGIALARVRREAAAEKELRIRIRGKDARAIRVRKTFV
jgi:aminomethyltransferase